MDCCNMQALTSCPRDWRGTAPAVAPVAAAATTAAAPGPPLGADPDPVITRGSTGGKIDKTTSLSAANLGRGVQWLASILVAFEGNDGLEEGFTPSRPKTRS